MLALYFTFNTEIWSFQILYFQKKNDVHNERYMIHVGCIAVYVCTVLTKLEGELLKVI